MDLLTLAQAAVDPQKAFWSTEETGYHAAIAGLMIVLVLAAAFVWRLWTRFRRGGSTEDAADADSSRAAFNSLARDLSVRLSDRLLLARVARQQELVSPLMLLFSAHALRHHARQFVTPMHRYRAAALMRRVARLRRQLFPS